MHLISLLKIFRVVIIWSATLCIVTSSSAQWQNYAEWENGVTERWRVDLDDFPKQELDNAVARWNIIEKDVQNIKSHEWAGGYFTGGSTHGTYMRWSQQTGFIMAHVDKCAARLMGLSYGKVIISPVSVDFIFEYRKSTGSHGHTKSHTHAPTIIKFIPVKWSNDQYLVQENEVAAFGDYVAGLGKYNQEFAWIDGMEFFARGTSEEKSNYEGLPQVPPGYERFIKRPIDAAIVSVGASYVKRVKESENPWWNNLITPVTLNAGRVDGVKRGMKFRVLGSESGEVIKVTRVGKHSSRGIIVRSVRKRPGVKVNQWDDGVDVPDPVISVGWQLSTSPHK